MVSVTVVFAIVDACPLAYELRPAMTPTRKAMLMSPVW